ncbi:MAG: nucleotide exchange factor GrpE [Clostridia bacterium]|nr:nucleotide exchange factor GrpE [Clostridia bacterium]
MEKDLDENLEVNSEENTEDIIELKKKIESQKVEIADKDDRLKRLMAEFDNFKKRSAKEREGLYNSLISDIAISLLPVIDNLEKAVSVKTEDNNYKIGVELVLKQFKDVLKSNGINEIEAVGKTFDPELHEAVSSVEDPDLGVQEIKEEYRKGYMIGDKVIRHSLVVVAN